MADKSLGAITLLRAIQHNWCWKRKPFDEAHAWIDLLLLANFKDNELLFEGQMIIVKRGELITSSLKLAERWGWTRGKVRWFLGGLKHTQQILPQNIANQATKITICKYNELQKLTTNQTTNQQPTNNQPTTINKNVKNVKNDNLSSPTSPLNANRQPPASRQPKKEKGDSLSTPKDLPASLLAVLNEYSAAFESKLILTTQLHKTLLALINCYSIASVETELRECLQYYYQQQGLQVHSWPALIRTWIDNAMQRWKELGLLDTPAHMRKYVDISKESEVNQ